MAYSIYGMVGAPMLAVFTLGMLLPWVNKWVSKIGQVRIQIIGFGLNKQPNEI